MNELRSRIARLEIALDFLSTEACLLTEDETKSLAWSIQEVQRDILAIVTRHTEVSA